MGKLRTHFKDLKANAWHYHNQREQAKLKKRLQLFKVLSIVQDKMKRDKYFALMRI